MGSPSACLIFPWAIFDPGPGVRVRLLSDLCGATSTHPEQQTWLTMQSACLSLAWPGLFSRLAVRVPISFLSFPDFLHPLLRAGRRSCPSGCRRVTIPASI